MFYSKRDSLAFDSAFSQVATFKTAKLIARFPFTTEIIYILLYRPLFCDGRTQHSYGVPEIIIMLK